MLKYFCCLAKFCMQDCQKIIYSVFQWRNRDSTPFSIVNQIIIICLQILILYQNTQNSLHNRQPIMNSISNSMSSKKNFKIVLLGDSAVGKTALIERYAHNRFEQKQNPTIGIDFVGKNVNIKGHTYRLQLWDTAGQQRYRSLIPSYLKDATAAIFIFDITNPTSLQNLEQWIQIFKESKTDKSTLVACGNKSDLMEKKNYNQQSLKKLLTKYKMKNFQVSALTGQGVSQMFQSVVQQVHGGQEKKKKKFQQIMQMMGPNSSTSLAMQQMKSNRSNRSQQQRYKQQPPQQTNIKLKTAIGKPRSTESITLDQSQNQSQGKGKEGQHLPGQNRCC